MTRLLKVSLVLAAIATTTSGSMAAELSAASPTAKPKAALILCTKYQHWAISGSTVICYLPGGNACQICDA